MIATLSAAEESGGRGDFPSPDVLTPSRTRDEVGVSPRLRSGLARHDPVFFIYGFCAENGA